MVMKEIPFADRYIALNNTIVNFLYINNVKNIEGASLELTEMVLGVAGSLYRLERFHRKVTESSVEEKRKKEIKNLKSIIDSSDAEKIKGVLGELILTLEKSVDYDFCMNGKKLNRETMLLNLLNELVGWARKFDVSYSLSKGEVSDKNIFNLFVVICDFVGFEGHWFNVQASSLGGIVRPKMNLIKKTADSCDGEVGWRDYFYVISRG